MTTIAARIKEALGPRPATPEAPAGGRARRVDPAIPRVRPQRPVDALALFWPARAEKMISVKDDRFDRFDADALAAYAENGSVPPNGHNVADYPGTPRAAGRRR